MSLHRPFGLIAPALILTFLCPARAQEAAAPPPPEATGPDAAVAKAWLEGPWTMAMPDATGEEGATQPIVLLFAADGLLTIAFPGSDKETGAWRITAAAPASASVLLDEDELDGDPSDDVYLDVTILNENAGKGVLRSPGEDPPVAVSMTRGGGAAPALPEPVPGAPVPPPSPISGPVSLSATPAPSIAGAIEAAKSVSIPADARIESAAIDLNGDGQDEALVKVTHRYWCSGGMEACRIWILALKPNGVWDSLGYPYAKGVALLDSSTNGYRDLSFDGIIYTKSEYGGYERRE